MGIFDLKPATCLIQTVGSNYEIKILTKMNNETN